MFMFIVFMHNVYVIIDINKFTFIKYMKQVYKINELLLYLEREM